MKKMYTLTAFCCALTVLSTGCGMVSEKFNPQSSADAQNTPAVEDVTQAQADTPISTAFVSAGSQEYVVLHSSADENAGSVARMYTGENIEIYELKDQWYYVKYGDVSGYVQASSVSFTQPEAAPVQNAVPAETSAQAISADVSAVQTPAATVPPAQAPAVNNEINNTVNIVLQYDNDGIALPLSYSNVGYVDYGSSRNAYCSTTSCYIYKTASTSGPKREADMLYNGDPVTVYGDYDGFYYIGTDSGSGYELKGYVQMKYITIGTPPASDKKNYSASQGYVSVGSCNVRSSPSKADDSNVIGVLKQGATFTVNSFDGYWYYINYSGGSGYVSHKMVTVY